MLGAGTQAADHQEQEERNETARGANAEKTDGRQERSAPGWAARPSGPRGTPPDLEKGEGAE